ncbi:hypothetical protein C8Q75DRAFT_731609 [Abortiporus biennis]|nr:hypothetical protein C8Q75DRAFT_731609 [Abortiporus biennis]
MAVALGNGGWKTRTGAMHGQTTCITTFLILNPGLLAPNQHRPLKHSASQFFTRTSRSMSSKRTAANLRPSTSSASSRYDRVGRVAPRHIVVKSGLYAYAGESEPLYLPPAWTAYNHPEGNVYFARDSTPRVLVEINLYNRQNQDTVAEWIDIVDNLIRERNIHLSESVEIVLDPSPSGETCGYYLVDNSTRVEFWFDDEIDTESLGISPVASESHLPNENVFVGIALEELYWEHVEHFPSHPTTGQTLLIDDLTDVLLQSRADTLMSNTSTFPWSAQDCNNFLDVLKTARECNRLNSSHTKWAVARLWVTVSNHRFTIHYGQDQCRLSRDQSIVETEEEQRKWLYNVSSKLLFNVPTQYSSLLDDLYIDQLVYANQWRDFIDSCKEEWRITTAVSFAIAICNLLISIASIGSPFFTLMSFATCNASIISGVLLLFNHHRSGRDTATEAACFLVNAHNGPSGFQRLSILLSLPRAFLYWSLILTSLQIISVPVSASGLAQPFVLAGAALVALVIGLAYLVVLSIQKAMVYFRSRKNHSDCLA